MRVSIADNICMRHQFCQCASIFMAVAIILLISWQHITPASSQPESTNIIGYFDFRFKASDFKKSARPWRYTWHNAGTVASVEHINNLFAKRGKVIVYDGAGHEVYSHSLGTDGIYLTNPGIAGEWTIQVVFDHQAD